MIEIIFLDVDGCLTDGKIIYNANGEELKFFDVKDGYAIESWLKLGKKVAIITGRKSAIVERRAEDLKINHVYQGVGDKFEVASEILKFEGLSFKNAAAIGDDYNDYKILDAVGDLSLLGAPLLGDYTAFAGSHDLNHKLTLALMADEKNYEIATLSGELLKEYQKVFA